MCKTFKKVWSVLEKPAQVYVHIPCFNENEKYAVLVFTK